MKDKKVRHFCFVWLDFTHLFEHCKIFFLSSHTDRFNQQLMVLGGCYVNPQGRIIESSLGKGTSFLYNYFLRNYFPTIVILFVWFVKVGLNWLMFIYFLLHFLHD